MKILIISQFYYPDNFTVSLLAESFVKQGNEVTVLTAFPSRDININIDGYSPMKNEVINGVNIHRVNVIKRKNSKLSLIKNYLSFRKNSMSWVKKCNEEYDVVYSFATSPVTILCAGNLYKKKHNVRHIGHVLDLWPESVLATKSMSKHSPLYLLLYYWSKSLYSKLDKIIIGSPSFKEYFNSVLGINNIPIEYISQPSLVENYSGEKYIYEERGTHIVYCGNVSELNLIQYIVPAMEKIDYSNVYFHIIGYGNFADNLTNQIAYSKAKNHIIYHGPMSYKESSKYLSSANAIYVSLANRGYVGSTIPNKLTMALAFSKPIIAMIQGDGKDILESTKGAILVEESSESLAICIEKLHNLSLEEQNKMGHNNLVFFNSHYKLNDITNKLLSAFSSK